MIKLVNAHNDIDLSPVHKPFPYQAEAFDALIDKDFGAVFHEQGLGKTKIAIDLALEWVLSKKVDSILFVTKKGLVTNWKREIAAHTRVRPWILSGNSSDNFVGMNSPVRFYITHYELIRSALNSFQLFFKTRDVGIILDEAQKIKNPDSTLANAFFKIAPLLPKKLILTGTPIANRPHDIWALIYFLDQGESLGSSFDSFKTDLELSRRLQGEEEKSKYENALETIQKKISSFSIRETKSGAGIDLPNKEYRSIYCSPSTIQKEMYDSYKTELKNIVLKDGKLREDRVDDILKRMTRLIQVASNPRLIDDNYEEDPGKLQPLLDCLHKVFDSGEKAIVWSAFTENVDWLAKVLKSHGAVKIHGKLAMPERDKSVEKFMNNSDCKVLIATPASAKEGLTLTVANHVVFYDRGFSLDDYLQAQDRIHRISQTQTCYVTSIVCEDSIDEWVDQLLTAKELSAKLGQGDISRDEFRDLASFSFFDELSRFLGVEANDQIGEDK